MKGSQNDLASLDARAGALDHVAAKLRAGESEGAILDGNGNRVGEFVLYDD